LREERLQRLLLLGNERLAVGQLLLMLFEPEAGAADLAIHLGRPRVQLRLAAVQRSALLLEVLSELGRLILDLLDEQGRGFRRIRAGSRGRLRLRDAGTAAD
jgi:hypothetical protein